MLLRSASVPVHSTVTQRIVMCGIFATSDPALLANKALIESCLQRRGTEKVVWQSADGYAMAHCLLPVRGEAPVLQPLSVGEKFLLYSGELWAVEGGRSAPMVFADRPD